MTTSTTASHSPSPFDTEAPTITTARTILRQWRTDDLPLFAALNADREVMRHFPTSLDRAQSDAVAHRLAQHLETHGFGPWAMEIPGVTPFAGFVGLMRVGFDAPFVPAVEIGWRLARAWWSKGYATEAATAAARYAFDTLGMDDLVSFTVPANVRSRAVMQRIGMRHCPDEDFLHPLVPPGHRLRRHVLYRLNADELKA
ncbi:GNAT family N-acetyltransferase [Pandoraea faecigallinarum]|uniref:GNAT family N-acetyltransferase n=1 Tax=Pandoraea faecigallinarum TaxID=656179 RepID=UPI0009FD394B|nr:GNAT family N-acetyltransferase [Pandoraea faecigallinarum]